MDQNESTNDSFSNETTDDIRKKIISKAYTVSLKGGRSRVWEVFGQIETDTGEVLESYVSCKRCYRVFKFGNASTSNLVKHKCYVLWKNDTESTIAPVVVNMETKKKFEHILLQWTIKNCRPIDLIEDSGLHKLAEFLIATGARYGSCVNMDELIPQPEEILKNVSKLYIDYSEKFKNELKSIRNVGYSLTTGVWSDVHLGTTYVLLTIQYIKNGELINRFLGMESIEADKYTDEDIKLAVEEILENFDCSLDDKLTFVIKKNDRMTEAFHSSERFFCINHLLHCALEEAIDETTEIRNIFEMSTKLFNFLKNLSQKFDSAVESGTPNRWNIIFCMLSSIVTNWNEALKICKSHKGDESKIIKSLNLKQITALQKFFEPFDEASKELASISSPTLHLAMVHAHRLRKMCVKNIDDLVVIKKFKVNLLNSFDKHVWQNMTLQHKVALYLFPPTNKLISFSASDRDLIRAECKRIMQTYIVEEEDEEEEEVSESGVAYSAMQIDDKPTQIDLLTEMNEDDEKVDSPTTKSIKSLEIFKDFMEVNGDLSTVEEKMNTELRLYEDTNVMLRDDFNLIQWWHSHRTHFPMLYKTSCKILAIPATTIASEEAILKARPLIFETRSTANICSNSVIEILFLHYNVDKNEMFYEMVIDENF